MGVSGRPGRLFRFPPSPAWLTSGRDSFECLSGVTSAWGLSTFGGNGGGRQGFRGEGEPRESTATGSDEGKGGVMES